MGQGIDNRSGSGAANALSWGLLALAATSAAAGAAAGPAGQVLFGLPGPGVLCAAAAGGVALLLIAGRSAASLALGLAVPLGLAVLLPRVPGVGAVTGPPLFALVAAVVVAGVARGAKMPPRWALLAVVFSVYCIASARVQLQVGPQGDEPHYLMVADSLLRDGDVSLERDYAEGRYGAFVDEPLLPHYRVRGRHGEIYSLHAVGLSLLILPAYALGGYPAVSFFMALLAALLAREMRTLLHLWLGDERWAEGVAWVIALSPPMIHYAGLVFTELPAALCVAVALRLGSTPRSWTWGGALMAAACAGFLPWLNVRYAPLAIVVLAFGLRSRPGDWRRRGAQCGAIVASATALALYHYALYGFFDPRRVYGRRPEFALRTLGEGLPGLLLDQEFGLLVYAPLFALAVPGVVSLLRERWGRGMTVLLPIAIVLATAGTWPMWRGGFNPPGRFLVPLVPFLALAVGRSLKRGISAPTALLIGWSLFVGLAGAWSPWQVHRDRDETAPFWRVQAGATEWTRLLPRYVLGEPDRHGLAAVWALVLVLGVLRRRGPARPGGFAVACAGLVLAAGVAERWSTSRSLGREAVHLVGRPAVAWPPGVFVQRADAEWGTGSLDIEPVYQPHRHPNGALFAGRLGLAPGRYLLAIEAEDLAPEMQPPQVLLGFERARLLPTTGTVSLRRSTGRLEAEFEVPDNCRGVSFLLRAGGPLGLRRFRLEAQPAPVPSV